MENGNQTVTATVTGDPVQDRLASLHAYQQITQRWASLVDDSEPEAYGALRKDLMDYGALIVSGGLMSAKEHLDKLEDLQQHIRKQGTSGKSVTDQFTEWFNEPSEVDES